MATIGFYGATRQVTGSMYLFTTEEGYKILVDCGLSYEQGEEMETNARFPFNPEEIDLVVLTHAHIDHSGNLPTLVHMGYEGQILCTEPTAALTDILLSDSASIQGMKQKKRSRGNSKSSKAVNGYKRLYGHKQVMDAVDRLITWPFGKIFEIHPGLGILFRPAGHILGAASVEIHFTEGGVKKVAGFSGDLGSPNSQIVVDPEPLQHLDYLVMESTYGGRFRKDRNEGEEVLEKFITETCVSKPGRLIIPAFSVGRTQAILYTIHKLFEKGRIPRGIRVFTDSKMGMFSTGIHLRFVEYLNSDAQTFLKKHESLFSFPELFFIENEKGRQILDNHKEPCIIVSSAGMMEGGRIMEHVTNHIQNPGCTFLIAGFCAPGTLGDQLLQGNSEVHFKGKTRTVYARIASTDAFSAHPDHDGLTGYIRKTSELSSLKAIFLTHGEEEAIRVLKQHLEPDGIPITIPEKGEQIVLQ